MHGAEDDARDLTDHLAAHVDGVARRGPKPTPAPLADRS
jgi:hypothetical protein